MLILFVCSGNTCRSPMAEALANHLASRIPSAERPTFLSAGIGAAEGDPASTGAVDAMKRRGLDLTNHRARRVTRELIDRATRVYTMTEAHRRQLSYLAPEHTSKIRTLAAVDVGDPFGASFEVYETVAAEIEREVRRVLAQSYPEA